MMRCVEGEAIRISYHNIEESENVYQGVEP